MIEPRKQIVHVAPRPAQRHIERRRQLVTRLCLHAIAGFVTKLDNEARDRMQAKARHELTPPFDMPLGRARGDVNDLLPRLDHFPLSDTSRWDTFRNDLSTYVEITKDSDRFSQEGFAKFRDVDAELNEVIRETASEQEHIFDRNAAAQKSATRSILTWNVSALLAGLLVAAATIWQVQRRFRQTR